MRLLAIELRRAKHGETEILIPTVYGSESADDKNARASRNASWTHASVDEWLRARDASIADAVVAFSEQLATAGYRLHGGGTGTYPSFSYGVSLADGGEVYPFSVYCGEKPTLGLNFQWVERSGATGQKRFLDDILATGAQIDAAAVEAASFRRRISVPLTLISDPAKRQQLVAAAQRLTLPPAATSSS
jgi:hypothetical protein